MATEIHNKEGFVDTLLGTDKNEDGTPVQEVAEDGKVVAEIHNKEGFVDTLLGTDKNEDGTPVKEVTSTGS